MDDSIWAWFYSVVANTWVATTQNQLDESHKGIDNSHFFLQYSFSRRRGIICCCGSVVVVVLWLFYKAFKILLTFLSFSFFSRSIERATLIQFDSRYLSKRVRTSPFTPFKREGNFDVWMVLFWHHQPLGFFFLPRLGVGLGIGKSMHILVYCGDYVE